MLKYFLNFFRYLIFRNPIKILFLLSAIITFNYAGSFKNGLSKIEVVTETQKGPDWIYVVVEKGNSSGYDLLVSNKKEKLVDGFLTEVQYNDLNILFWILFTLSTIFTLVSTFIGIVNDDEDISWDIDGCRKSAARSLIYCELENDTYYYMALGRLIEKSSNQLQPHRISCDSLEYIKQCPKFSTKTQKRNNLLHSIGI